MAVKFEDYSYKIKADLNDVSATWLTECGFEVAAKANDNVKMDGEAGAQLHGSYRPTRRYKDHIKVGTPLEAGYWEEFGTGEHAVQSPSRSGWWVYIDGGSGYEGDTRTYKTREEAESMAEFIRREYGKPAIATDGRDPNYTLENAFKSTMPGQEKELERRLKERFGE